jgi:hypothetical protein
MPYLPVANNGSFLTDTNKTFQLQQSKRVGRWGQSAFHGHFAESAPC